MDHIIEMIGITKRFPGIIANNNVTLRLERGEIHAILGENGAGKSTLMSVLFGLYQPDEGIIKKDGREVKIADPKYANKLGIGMVHQHFMLVENFTVLQNIVLGVESTKNGALDMKEAREKVLKLSEKYGLSISPDALVSDITVGMQQRVEILKMLYRSNEVLVFDEPTAVLTPHEIDELMNIMKNMTKEGKSIIFITHKLDEIKKVARRCTILRKGSYVGTVDVESTSKEELSKMMVGREVNLKVDKKETALGDDVLVVKNLCVKTGNSSKNTVNNVSLNVRSGEIVCIAGIDGNGQSELVSAITGLSSAASGSIQMSGNDMTKSSIRERSTIGMSYIPEDRHRYGLILDYPLAENLVLKSYFTKKFSNLHFLNFASIAAYAAKLIEKFDIRTSMGVKTRTRYMSGGNQQKAIIAREIDKEHSLLVAVQPTRGLDVGAIEYIHAQLMSERESGKAVLLISLELDEVMNVSDRILVISKGEIVGEFKPETITVEELGLYMAGAKRRAADA